MRSRIIALLTLAAITACSGHKDATAPDPPPSPATADVYTIGENIFSPPFLTIAQNTTVNFHIGQDGIAHDVTFRAVSGAPANIPLQINKVVARTFTVKGTFPYDCFVHPGMTGTITVQ